MRTFRKSESPHVDSYEVYEEDVRRGGDGKRLTFGVCFAFLALAPSVGFAQGTNASTLGASLPDAGLSLLRVIGSLGLVLALFFGAVWCFKNWQRLAAQKGRAPKLRVLEVRSLGHRQALYLVACEQQRLLVASSPAGVTLLAHLPEGDPSEAPLAPGLPNFADALQRVLAPKA